MKKLLTTFLVCPIFLFAQQQEYGVFQSVTISPNPANITEFEANMAAHNKTYHNQAPYGARVYSIASGPNVGNYIWNMGPLPWSAMDGRPGPGEHSEDWVKNVLPNVSGDAYGRYWKAELEISRLPSSFKLDKLLVWYVDVERFQQQKMNELMKSVQEVYAALLPDEIYGVYTSELPSTSDGKDMAIVWFFGDSAWMGKDLEFAKHYNAHHGEGSFAKFLEDFGAASLGVESELWVFREDLSGLGAEVEVQQ